MGAQARHERLAALLTPLLAEAGLELESIEVTPAGKRRLLRVVVDSDNGVDLDAVGEVSQEISTALDSSDAMGKAPYVLEVTSPGVDRPLTLPRHWRRSRGRLVRAATAEGGEVQGRVKDADDDGVTLEVDGRDRRYGYSDLRRAKVQVEFRRETGDDAAD
ncbi:ribosome maturation factor RimP [Streptomonospora nanhaiensis]|uniref:Ribosome maturation factor RimP n=1 Tax=Streptomonospora nanhaiensis TaxID=1323731 RepID=A0A853BTA7_9ACTN|nr:ribosome maturation factor RimP [Streptomonospora nanhaiensis]MBV2365803.1 ribosome maturation factor RimP [Streptomonospora nanhaiensis]MBX9390760.1 ribosome maturation factor RimP [Streptomonospora nanhaiensis]NYI98164.1 ribosome maturation factor RimP [Streptomonospora nanhaiensis]